MISLNDGNFILKTDSYKLTHAPMYPQGTTGVFSYFEARNGAKFPATVFFGLQSILFELAGNKVYQRDVDNARRIAEAHFGPNTPTNLDGWQRIVDKHGGRLPVRIKAVPEGSVVPNGNVLMTVENTDPELPWVTNALESILTHVWYPSTVATQSYFVKQYLRKALKQTADSLDALPFMLHDFGYRGATTDEAAAIGGAGHLVNFMGTDTLVAMELLMRDYDADLANLAFSVPATEHSVMTAMGPSGESSIVSRLIDEYPTGILSVVADSYNIYEFVDMIGRGEFKERILARDGKFVVRPDSITVKHDTPHALVEDLLGRLWDSFGGTVNSKGYKVLNPKVGLLWGDGIDPQGIQKIVNRAVLAGFSAENLVFGMGGGLLQKINRDTQRFAFKSSAQERDGVWYDVMKKPLDASKASKAGRLTLVAAEPHGYATVREEYLEDGMASGMKPLLQTVFEDGQVTRIQTLDEVRARAK